MENKDKEKNQESSFKKKKRIFGALAVATASLGAIGVYGATELYDAFFKRYDLPDYSLVAGLYDYEKIKDVLPREEISFTSDKIRLQGYYYASGESDKLLVISHGLHAGSDDYLPIIEFFVNHGYNVFGYDYKGTYRSDGDSTVGMLESLVDLDNCLTFIKKDLRFKDKKLFLLGHSWGAFATAAVLCKHKGISACCCISGFNSGYTLITEKGFQYAGELANKGLSKPFLDVYQKILFKNYVGCTAVDGINASGVPIVLAHGLQDKVIDYSLQSITSKRPEIYNKNVTYYSGVGLQSGHDSIWHSTASIEYQNEISQKTKNLSDAELVEFYKTVDHRLYSEINLELFDLVLQTFNKA